MTNQLIYTNVAALSVHLNNTKYIYHYLNNKDGGERSEDAVHEGERSEDAVHEGERSEDAVHEGERSEDAVHEDATLYWRSTT